MSIDTEVRKILNQIRSKVESSDDGGIYGDRSKALKDIDSLLVSASSESMKYLLVPTGNLQELSIENGWGNELNQLAKELEDLLGI